MKIETTTDKKEELTVWISLVITLQKSLTTIIISENNITPLDDDGFPLIDILSTCRSLRHLSAVTNRAIQYNIINDDTNNSEATASLAKATNYYYELRTFVIRYRGGTLNQILQDIIR